MIAVRLSRPSTVDEVGDCHSLLQVLVANHHVPLFPPTGPTSACIGLNERNTLGITHFVLPLQLAKQDIIARIA